MHVLVSNWIASAEEHVVGLLTHMTTPIFHVQVAVKVRAVV